MSPCARCGVEKPATEFYRRRRTGRGSYRGENARRGICKACERKAYPQARKAGPRKAYMFRAPSKHGIREDLLAKGLKSGSAEYKKEYFKLYQIFVGRHARQ